MVNTDKDFIYIGLDLYDFTLEAWINQKDVKTLPMEDWSEQAVGLVDGFLKGLEYLHSKDILHRDLKVSDNCFFFLIRQVVPKLNDKYRRIKTTIRGVR